MVLFRELLVHSARNSCYSVVSTDLSLSPGPVQGQCEQHFCPTAQHPPALMFGDSLMQTPSQNFSKKRVNTNKNCSRALLENAVKLESSLQSAAEAGAERGELAPRRPRAAGPCGTAGPRAAPAQPQTSVRAICLLSNYLPAAYRYCH